MYRVIHKGKKYIFVRHKNILAIWNQLFYFSHKKTPASLIHLLWLFSVLKCILFLQQSTWDRGLIMWENITQHKTNWTSILWSMRTCWRLGIFFLLLYVYSHSVVDIGFTCESVCVCVWTDFVNVIASQDTVMKLHRCVVEIKMKAEFKDGRGSRGEVDPWPTFILSYCILVQVIPIHLSIAGIVFTLWVCVCVIMA